MGLVSEALFSPRVIQLNVFLIRLSGAEQTRDELRMQVYDAMAEKDPRGTEAKIEAVKGEDEMETEEESAAESTAKNELEPPVDEVKTPSSSGEGAVKSDSAVNKAEKSPSSTGARPLKSDCPVIGSEKSGSPVIGSEKSDPVMVDLEKSPGAVKSGSPGIGSEKSGSPVIGSEKSSTVNKEVKSVSLAEGALKPDSPMKGVEKSPGKGAVKSDPPASRAETSPSPEQGVLKKSDSPVIGLEKSPVKKADTPVIGLEKSPVKVNTPVNGVEKPLPSPGEGAEKKPGVDAAPQQKENGGGLEPEHQEEKMEEEEEKMDEGSSRLVFEHFLVWVVGLEESSWCHGRCRAKTSLGTNV